MSASIEADPIERDDPRYAAVLDKAFNKRFRARPDYVCLAASAAEAAAAVEQAVRENRRLVVTSGGHCLEGFVSDPDARVILDVSPMKSIEYDVERGAIVMGAGVTVGEAFAALAERWGVVVPFGEYPGIGLGGHVPGGAFGFLCRELGLAADYLEAVEVVTVKENGLTEIVVAGRDPSDPHYDLWWAHTGGGAGNFGVATRFWFRSRDAQGDAPSTILPRIPDSIATFKLEWSWDVLDRRVFERLVSDYGAWSEQNSAPASPAASLWSLLEMHRKPFGIVFRGLAVGSEAERRLDDYLAAVGEGLPAPSAREFERMSWLEFALNPFPDLFTMPPGGVCMKGKDALLRRGLSARQVGVAYDYLTRADFDVPGGMFALATYGGAINAIAPDATASAQRGSIFDMAVTAGWIDPTVEAAHLEWIRAFYRDLFADTGGVPVPSAAYEGSFINHPDPDHADPAFNTSGVPWHALYYQDNYPRLQRVKKRWDPRNLFRHALSIRPSS